MTGRSVSGAETWARPAASAGRAAQAARRGRRRHPREQRPPGHRRRHDAPDLRGLASTGSSRPTPAALRRCVCRPAGGRAEGRVAAGRRRRHGARTTDEAVVEAHELTKRFGDFTAADNISFRIGRGEIFGLLRPQRCRQVDDVQDDVRPAAPDRGTARVAGYDLYRAGGSARRRLGYMAQKFSLYGDLSVRQNLDFFAGVYGLGRARERRHATARMIETFELGPYLDANAGDIAAGFQAAAGAGLRRDARAGRAVPGRADLGRRPAHAARVLVAHQRAWSSAASR